MPDPLVFRAGAIDWEAGEPEQVRPLFNAIADVEPTGWGSRFPRIMNDLYRGEISAASVREARTELRAIRNEVAGSFRATGGDEMLSLLDEALVHGERLSEPVFLAHEYTFEAPRFEVKS